MTAWSSFYFGIHSTWQTLRLLHLINLDGYTQSNTRFAAYPELTIQSSSVYVIMHNMARKKSSPRKHVTHNQTHIMLKKGLLVYAALVFLFFILFALSAFAVIESKKIYDNYQRQQEVMSIYQDLKLDETYRLDDMDVYTSTVADTSDSKHGQTSSITYGRNADRQATFADLEKRIKAAGFTKVDNPDHGELARQDHYENDDGEVIRVSIETAAWHEAMLYGTELPTPQSKQANIEGPVYITIKVGLGDDA